MTSRPGHSSSTPKRRTPDGAAQLRRQFEDTCLQYQELQRAHAALQEVERRKDAFLATLAHELRNPLGPLRNGLEIMEMAPRDPRMLDAAHAMMKRQVQRMVGLIDDLIDISRITQGRLELRREDADLLTIVRNAVDSVRSAMEESGHTLNVRLPDEPLYVSADPGRVSQVLAGLLRNAGTFTGRGGRIELTARRDGAIAAVSVRDNGVGIEPHVLPRMFELFAQAEPLPDSLEAGLGVGLAIAASLVRMHGGSIEALSEGRGTGSEFIVRLPLIPAPTRKKKRAERDAGTAAATRGENQRRRILVADDNVDAARSLAQLLTLGGHEVRSAYRGSDAYELADWFRPDVALLDLAMPQGNGYETCRRIRAQRWGQSMTLIALTGWSQPSHQDAAFEAGFDHHLVKPVEPAELLALLERIPAASVRETPS